MGCSVRCHALLLSLLCVSPLFSASSNDELSEHNSLSEIACLDYEGVPQGGASGSLVFVVMASNTAQRNNSQYLPGVCLAVTQAKAMLPFMEDYNVTGYFLNTKGGSLYATNRLYYMFQLPQPVIGIVGPAYSDVASGSASLATSLGVNMVSFAAEYSGNDESSIFRTVMTLDSMTGCYWALFEHFYWRRAAVVVLQGQEPFYKSAIRMQAEGQSRGMNVTVFTLVNNETITSETTRVAKNIKSQGFTIIIVWLYDEWAEQLFCQFYAKDMYGEQYFFFGLPSWKVAEWAEFDPCTRKQVALATDGYASLVVSGNAQGEDTPTDVGLTSAQYTAEVTGNFSGYSTYSQSLVGSGLAFDATWALLAALNRTAAAGLDLTQFSYDNLTISRSISHQLGSPFVGVSGEVEFEPKSRDRVQATLKVFQYNSTSKTSNLVGVMETPSTLLRENIVFSGGSTPPRDHSETIFGRSSGLYVAFAIIVILCILGICFCLAAIAVILHSRNKPVLQVLSPYNNIANAVGGVLTFTGVLIYGVITFTSPAHLAHSSNAWLCVAYDACVAVGFSLSYFALMSKVYRVFIIVHLHESTNKKVPSDNLLIVYGLVGSLVYTFINIAQFFEKPPKILYTNSLTEAHAFAYCTAKPFGFFVLSAVFTSAMQVMGMFYCWQTRKVRLSALNESKKIAVVIYTLTVMNGFRWLLKATSSSQDLTNDFLWNVTQIIMQAMMAGVVFVPALYRLARKSDWRIEAKMEQDQNLRHYLDDYPELRSIRSIDQVVDLFVQTSNILEDNAILKERLSKPDPQFDDTPKRKQTVAARIGRLLTIRPSKRTPALSNPVNENDFL